MQQYIEDRDRALFSLDRRRIEAYAQKYQISLPGDSRSFWAVVYKAILQIEGAPTGLRRAAQAWLRCWGYRGAAA